MFLFEAFKLPTIFDYQTYIKKGAFFNAPWLYHYIYLTGIKGKTSLLSKKHNSSFKKQQRTATAISKLASNKSNDEANFEHYFRSNYPWQKIYIAENVEKALEEVKKA